MIPKRGFFQPIDTNGKIGWVWWSIFLMIGIIAWSEMLFKIDIVIICYLLIILGIGVIMIFRRRVYIAGSQIFLGRLFISDYEKISLSSLNNWRLNGKLLSFERAGRVRKYWLSKNIATQIKEYMDTHDRKDNS